jgi:hypothetical protein
MIDPFENQNNEDTLIDPIANSEPSQPQEDSFISNVGRDWGERIDYATSPETYKGMKAGIIEAPLRVAGEVFGAGADVVTQGLRSAYKTLMPEREQQYVKDVGKEIKGVSDYWGVTPVLEDAVNYWGGQWKDFKKEYPNLSKDIGAGAEIAFAAPMLKGAYTTAKTSLPIAKAIAKEPIKFASDIKNIIKPIPDEGIDKALGQITSERAKNANLLPTKVRGSSDIQAFKDNLQRNVKTIINNKDKIKFLDEYGNPVKGAVPQTMEEWSQAIPQAKDAVSSNINNILDSAKDANVRIPTKNSLDLIEKLKTSEHWTSMEKFPKYDSVRKEILEIEKRIKESGNSLTPQQARTNIAILNRLVESTKDDLAQFFFKGLLKAERTSLYETIDSLSSSSFKGASKLKELNKDWGALEHTEKRIAQRANQIAGQEGKMYSYWDMATLAEGMAALTAGNVPLMIAAGGTKGGKEILGYLSSPNRHVKKLFNKSERMLAKDKMQSETGRGIQSFVKSFEEPVTPTRLPKSPYTSREIPEMKTSPFPFGELGNLTAYTTETPYSIMKPTWNKQTLRKAKRI